MLTIGITAVWLAVLGGFGHFRLAMILGNPVMIDAYRAGIPGNGQPAPDGAKMDFERLFGPGQ